MIRLSEVCNDRDNNFNIIRILAAGSVLISHAWPISWGPGTPEPLYELTGHTLGWTAVTLFFAISGFFISRSFDRKRHFIDWLIARILRLFPALAIVLLLTALLLGPFLTVLPLNQYFSDLSTYSYLLKNLSLVSMQYSLPGVFKEQIYPNAINGSLWTLFHEVACYVCVAIAGSVCLLQRKLYFAVSFGVLILVYLMVSHLGLSEILHGKLVALVKLSLPFSIGVAFYVFRDKLILSWYFSLVLFAALLPASKSQFFSEFYIIFLTYSVFCLAYSRLGFLNLYNKVGDYSYGLYIYAFPVQQIVIWSYGPMTPFTNILIAMPITLICAMLSWHLIEKRALKAKKRVCSSIRLGMKLLDEKRTT